MKHKPKLGDILVMQASTYSGEIGGEDLDHCAGSIEAAERWMRDYNREQYIDTGEMQVGADAEFAGPCYLCKVVKIVMPVPVVSVKVEIREVKYGGPVRCVPVGGGA